MIEAGSITEIKIQARCSGSDVGNAVFPFSEKPSLSRSVDTDKPLTKERIAASDLFSFFTADIIKEEVIFSR